MSLEFRHLRGEEYRALLTLLNTVFGRHNNDPTMDFEKSLPRAFDGTEEQTVKHLGAFEDGRLVSTVGIYPLPCFIGEEKLLFSTVGNVATHPDAEGRGYMNRLFSMAMREIEERGFDACRLSGDRRRYNRFGFEACGSIYEGLLLPGVIRDRYQHLAPLTFVPLEPDDEGSLAFANTCFARSAIHVDRTEKDLSGFYKAAIAWQNRPYIALDGDKQCGFIVVSPDGATVAEFAATDDETALRVLIGYARSINKPVRFSIPPCETVLLSDLARNASSLSCISPNHFRILSFDKVADALIKLKNKLSPLPEGSFSLGIEGFGTVTVWVSGAEAGARRSDDLPDLTLPHLAAERFLFGPFSPDLIAPVSPLLRTWLPLPLSWNLQDRV